ncbi:uncharacterized protein LAESUDRAFT_719829 [Laetiporus sulphureus 93-53]|uniref:Uncharacterized protein n=1 Tax=Laetiporus sulphureus 93-53 TaxID=1314785 RepID=A0A165HLI0_9APHY|nr:uncharacterized protein LAESUDRAFT_719829 [Laetiporus sulphureus 93-53]KZT11887.1 hypothetical protein LAESUDRAFT_719829 [Laetiporus sulphureus 93-53]
MIGPLFEDCSTSKAVANTAVGGFGCDFGRKPPLGLCRRSKLSSFVSWVHLRYLCNGDHRKMAVGHRHRFRLAHLYTLILLSGAFGDRHWAEEEHQFPRSPLSTFLLNWSVVQHIA